MCALATRSITRMSARSFRRERRLNAVIAEYIKAVQAGRTPDRPKFLERHWDLTDGLVSFFANEDRLMHMAGLASPRVVAEPRPRRPRRRTRSKPGLRVRCEFGEFELLSEIASGGMGVVYKARHKRLNRIVALKTIHPGVAGPSNDVVRRLRIEAKVVAALDHPNIVPLYEIGEQGGFPYLILKLITGGDLERHVPRLAQNPRAAARLIAKVARTVHFAHLHGVLHRDLKPSNILLDSRGEPHLTDFGLAKCIETESGLTQTGLILGTPAYMAPEQLQGRRHETTTAADIYGVGAVLYKLLTGHPPFQAETVYELLDLLIECEPVPPRTYSPEVDRDLEAICLKCLEKEPCRRYDSAAALAADLDRWLAGSPIKARPPGRVELISRWYHRNKKAVALSAVLVGLVMIFVLAAVVTATVICRYELAVENSGPTLETMAGRVQSAADRSAVGFVTGERRAQGAFEKLTPGSSAPSLGSLKLKCDSSCQVMLPTMGGPWSWANVKSPFPEVIRPWSSRS
jgi:tRNA A-37 threonylcarbamoyl transferase component Bud32